MGRELIVGLRAAGYTQLYARTLRWKSARRRASIRIRWSPPPSRARRRDLLVFLLPVGVGVELSRVVRWSVSWGLDPSSNHVFTESPAGPSTD